MNNFMALVAVAALVVWWSRRQEQAAPIAPGPHADYLVWTGLSENGGNRSWV